MINQVNMTYNTVNSVAVHDDSISKDELSKCKSILNPILSYPNTYSYVSDIVCTIVPYSSTILRDKSVYKIYMYGPSGELVAEVDITDNEYLGLFRYVKYELRVSTESRPEEYSKHYDSDSFIRELVVSLYDRPVIGSSNTYPSLSGPTLSEVKSHPLITLRSEVSTKSIDTSNS